MKPDTSLGMCALAAVILALSSCGSGSRSPSGFLSNYKQMDAGYGTANAVSAYVKPGVDLKKYDSVIIDPVTTVVASPGIGAAVKDQLAAYLGAALRAELDGDLKIASAPGPTTLRVRTALTDVIEHQKAGTPVTTVHSGARATLTGNLGSVDVAKFISNVSFEGEIVDSVTGERLLANVDHRLGSKREATPSTSWTEVRRWVNQGAANLRGRFKTLRGR